MPAWWISSPQWFKRLMNSSKACEAQQSMLGLSSHILPFFLSIISYRSTYHICQQVPSVSCMIFHGLVDFGFGDLLHWFCPGDLSDLGPRWEWRYLRSRADPGVDQTVSWVNLGETKGKGKPTGGKQHVPTSNSDMCMMCVFVRYRHRCIYVYAYMYICMLLLFREFQMNLYIL